MLPLVMGVGTTQYLQPATTEEDWEFDGRGLFSSQIDTNVFSQSLTDTHAIPIVGDFDNDGLNEIIILDDDDLIVMNNKELTVQDTIDIGNAPSITSNFLAFDIDGDGFLELIFHNDVDNEIEIFNYSNADGIQNQISFSVTENGYTMLACKDVDECIITLDSYSDENIFNPFDVDYRVQSFNSHGTTSSATILFTETQPSSDAMAVCSPRLRNIPVVDYDGDLIDEYVISFADYEEGDSFITYHLEYLNNITSELSTEETHTVPDADETTCDGENGIGNQITSPLVAEMFSTKGGKETFLGVMSDSNDFIIDVFDASGSPFEQFPEILEADGRIFSNPMLLNAFPETTGQVDVCVLGYDAVTQEINLLCGTSSRGGVLPDADEFLFQTDGTFNLSNSISELDIIAHGGQHSNELTDLQDLNEIISSHGVFKIDFTGINSLTRLYENTVKNSVLLSIDGEKVGSDDLLAMTPSNLFYIDDKLQRENPEIQSITFNPCIIDSIIKLNTSLQIGVVAIDNNPASFGNDLLTINVSIYTNTANHQSASVVDVQSGSLNQFLFSANSTGSGNVITVSVFDNASTTDTVTQTFSVANNGLEFGDSTCTSDYVGGVLSAEVDVLNITGGNLDEDDNIGNSVLILLQSTGLGGTGNWLLIMGFVAFLFIFGTKTLFGTDINRVDPKLMMLGLILIEVLLLMMGTAIGALPVGLTITIVVLVGIPTGLYLRNMIMGNQSGGQP